MTGSPNQFKISLFWEQITVISHCMTFILFFFFLVKQWCNQFETNARNAAGWWHLWDVPRISVSDRVSPPVMPRALVQLRSPRVGREPQPDRAEPGRAELLRLPGAALAAREGGGCVLHPRNYSLMYENKRKSPISQQARLHRLVYGDCFAWNRVWVIILKISAVFTVFHT